MSGMFVPADQSVRETLAWGTLAWCCRPAGTGAKGLVVIVVEVAEEAPWKTIR